MTLNPYTSFRLDFSCILILNSNSVGVSRTLIFSTLRVRYCLCFSWRIRISRHSSRSSRICSQVLHWGGQLGPDWQQHPHLLHQGCPAGELVYHRSNTFSSFKTCVLTSIRLTLHLFSMQFPSFIHSQKRNPQTHMKDPDMVWDFWSLRPESLHQVAAAEPQPAQAQYPFFCFFTPIT